MTDFQRQYRKYYDHFERALKNFCAGMNHLPPVLTESMRYSLLSGGKRMRPVLFFGALTHFGADFVPETGLAIALECIHTYSLIHDDLPAMDNDDFRRGNPSNHKVFGEANAILAGDALLSEAMGLMLRESGRSEKHLKAAQYLADAAGADGMIAGQSADLLYSGKTGGAEELDFIYAHKTGKLIAAPVVMAALLGGGDAAGAERFGQALGALFQITDDILDEKGESVKMGKTLGKDAAEDKLTCVKVYGMERAELLADQTAANCLALLNALGGDGFLASIVELVRNRDN